MEKKEKILNKEEMDSYIRDFTELGEGIIKLSQTINTIEDKNLKRTYNQDLQDLIKTFFDIEKAVQIELNKFIKKENEEGNIITFKYRKLLRDIRENRAS